MQLIAEAYDLIRQGTGASAAEIAAIFKTWNDGDLESFLIEITAEVLAHDGRRDRQGLRRHRAGPGRAEGHRPLDRAERPRPRRADHRHRRGDLRPRAVRLGAAARGRPAPSCRRTPRSGGRRPGRLRRGRAAGAVRLEGGRLLPGLRPDRRRQRGVRLEHRPRRDGPDLARRLHHPGPVPEPDHRGVRAQRRSCRCCSPTTTSPTRWATASPAWRRVVAGAAQNGIPTPAFSSSLAYYDGIRAERLPAALIQAQRDFFGAHTYRRVDNDGTFHTEWSGGPERDRSRGGGAAIRAATTSRRSTPRRPRRTNPRDSASATVARCSSAAQP